MFYRFTFPFLLLLLNGGVCVFLCLLLPLSARGEYLAVHGQPGDLHAATLPVPRGAEENTTAQELPACHRQHGGQVGFCTNKLYTCSLKQASVPPPVRGVFVPGLRFFSVGGAAGSRFAVATPDELATNDDDCAICWDAMATARRLPCGHLFHK